MDGIPWNLGESSLVSLWIWETEHFTARIQTDQHRVSFTWEVTDVSQGKEVSLADGFTGSFVESEKLVREIVGKSYPPTLGYQRFAGHYATTFIIFNNERIDFGPMVAKKVVLNVRMVDGNGRISSKRLVGRLNIENYSLRLTPEHGGSLKIPPSRVLSVQQEFGETVKPVVEEVNNGKTMRIYSGVFKRGCTGKPGFMPDTVEHPSRAERCPVHE